MSWLGRSLEAEAPWLPESGASDNEKFVQSRVNGNQKF